MRAVQYVRMSTERQEYSIANQAAAIAAYALLHEFEIVKTYSDPGKSGIDLSHRPGLQALLDDVANTPTDFEAILVYDISRWGRFQDIDESAYYEFLCKRAGIRVHYCAEPFANNDPSIMAMLLKAIKRAMAGEYLRELSAKTFAGQCRIARSGYKLGGKAGYGLRRLLVGRDGAPKQILADGERKGLASDRVVYVLGPDDEVAVVRQIYSWFLDEERSANAIAEMLNRRGVARQPNGPWDKFAVNQILNHPKYTGSMVFNRTSKKFRASTTTPNPIHQWIVTPDSFEAIISQDQFQAVRRRRKPMSERSDDELLSDLRLVLQVHGKLTVETIRATPGIPSPSTYWSRFGSLGKAYAAVGYAPVRGYFGGSLLRSKTLAMKAQTRLDMASLFRASGRKTIVIAGGLSISGFGKLGIDLAQWVILAGGDLRWEVRTRKGRRHKRAIVGRIARDQQSIEDFVFLDRLPSTKCNFRITEKILNEARRGTAEEIVAAVVSLTSPRRASRVP